MVIQIVKYLKLFRSIKKSCFYILVQLAMFLFSGCTSDTKLASNLDEIREEEETRVEDLYNKALDELEGNNYILAIESFENVERLHPYSVWATKAQLLAAFSHYKSNQYDASLLGLERFISLHPANKDVAYAYYLKALCYYEQISDVVRDQEMTQLALAAFKELLTRFPTSNYAKDGKLKLDLIYDHLAGKEMEIGRYYQNQGYYLAAINRFKNVVGQYQTTTHVAEALHRLTECYRALGLAEEAQKTAAVLGYNFPESDWYADSYDMLKDRKKSKRNKSEKSWYRFW